MAEGSLNERPLGIRLYLAAKRVVPRPFGRRPPVTVFVTGTPRSGTNMLMYALDRTFQTTALHETDPRAYEDFALRDLGTIRALRDSTRGSYMIVKCLMEGERLTDMTRALAPARGIWLTRHVDAMVRSHQKSFPGNREAIDEIVADRSAGVWRARGMSEETHELLRSAYRPGLSDENAAALFWWQRNRLVFDQRLPDRPDMAILDYDRLTENPHGTGRALAARLGLPYSRFMYSGIVARAPGVRREVPLAPHIRELCEEMWARIGACALRPSADDAA
ncbi:hypothetical protein B5C34_15275 [Pacificimonas flava]|uniref:Sulfotransferase domain-containing protein n=2 Tax=Pacificimonas TaxID=1960290 RepID=A0A219B0M7_9SPHN|nr:MULTISPECIES: sulfotransferase family protein [Pacificimonas]MBZ6379676.1 hypothetical protein [Pacificimonas aurantium]OWV31861.1 hypothetical protein B5C34_15275 [Pacificimonas flava]